MPAINRCERIRGKLPLPTRLQTTPPKNDHTQKLVILIRQLTERNLFEFNQTLLIIN